MESRSSEAPGFDQPTRLIARHCARRTPRDRRLGCFRRRWAGALVGVLLCASGLGAQEPDIVTQYKAALGHLQAGRYQRAEQDFARVVARAGDLPAPSSTELRFGAEMFRGRAISGRAAMLDPNVEKDLGSFERLVADAESALLLAAEELQKDNGAIPAAFREELWCSLVFPDQMCTNLMRLAEMRLRAGEPFLKVLADLEQRLDRIAEQLGKARFSQERCDAPYLYLAEWCWERQQLGELERLLDKTTSLKETKQYLERFHWQYHQLQARLATERRDYDEAFSALQEALKIVEASRVAPDTTCAHVGRISADKAKFKASTQQVLGYLYLRQGDYQRAHEQLKQAVEGFQQEGVLGAHSTASSEDRRAAIYALHNLGQTQARLTTAGLLENGYQLGLRTLDQALELTDAQQSGDAILRAKIQNNRGVMFYLLGRFEEARRVYEASLELVTAAVGPDHTLAAETRVNLAWLDLEAGQVPAAVEGFTSALASFRTAKNELRETECLAYLGRATLAHGDSETAGKLLLEATARRYQLVRQLLQRVVNERDRLVLVQEMRLHTEVAAYPGVFDSLIELAPQAGITPRQQYQQQLRWKGILSRQAPPDAEALEKTPEVQRLASRRRDLLDRLQNFAGGTAFYSLARQQLDAEGFQQYDEGFQEQERKLGEVEGELEEVNRELARLSPRFRAAVRDPADLDEIVQKLPSTAALFDVLEVEATAARPSGEPCRIVRSYVGFVVTPDAKVQRIDVGGDRDAGTIDNEISLYYTFLKDSDYSIDVILEKGQSLATWIRNPMQRAAPDARLWIISGDGWLHRLPFGALPGERDGTFWIEQRAFSFVTTPDRLVRSRAEGKRGALLVGGLDYGQPPPGARQIPWQPLQDTLFEIAALKGRFDEQEMTEIRTGRLATETEIHRLLPGFAYVHLATHGNFAGRLEENNAAFAIFDPRDRLNSSLVLSGVNAGLKGGGVPGGGRDQYLTAEEIGRLDLRGTRLVVLSACQTGLGHVREGQGMIGVLAALDEAGTETVVSSLWNVNSKATTLLMLRFYDRYLSTTQKLGAADAMRDAQLALLSGRVKSESGQLMEHPYYWAPWTVSGLPD